MSKISPYAQFLMDEDKEQNGIEFDTPWGTFIIARPGGSNKQFKALFQELTAPYRIRGIDIEELMDDEQSKSVFIELYARTVVKGWLGVVDADGNEIPFSVEACKKLLTDLEELFSVIMQAAQKMSLFRRQLDEADAGNSNES